MIIIPAIDLRQGKCVRLHQGEASRETVYGDDPVGMAQVWARGGVKRLHLVDLDGAFSGASVHHEVIKAIARTIPVEVGGGIRTLETVEDYLEAGVERVILGSIAAEKPELVAESCRRYPGRVMAGIDAKKGKVAIKGWTAVTEKNALDLARELGDLGILEIIYTDISRDGTLEGPNLPALAEMAQVSGLKVIASGGISSLEDLRQIKNLNIPQISGIIIGKALYDQRVDLVQAISLVEGGVG